MSQFLNVLKYMEQKFPTYILLAQGFLTDNVFDECTAETRTISIIAFSVFSLIILIFSPFRASWEFSQAYKNGPINQRYLYSGVNTFVSYLAYVTSSVYLFKGKPFTCWTHSFTYGSNIAATCFVFSFVLIVIISIVEHRYWTRLVPLPDFNNLA